MSSATATLRISGSTSKSFGETVEEGNPGGEITFRRGTLEDLNAIHDLDKRIFPPAVAFTPDAFLFLLINPSAVTIVAENHGKFVAFAGMERKSKTEGEVVTIDVEPELQRHGIGRALMEKLEDEAKLKGYETLYLQVAENSEGVVCFYEKLGYEKTRLMKGYYGRGVNAWEMKKSLKISRQLPPSLEGRG